MPDTQDCVVIGAGIIGLACARSLAQAGRDVLVLEAESAVATHTSSRNSEVIHAGIYYPQGSLKATLCVAGRDALYRYCGERGIGHRRIGKLIVATRADDCSRLDDLQRKAAANGVQDLRQLGERELAKMEPQVAALAGLYSPSTGIIDSHELAQAYQADLEAANGVVVCNSRVTAGSLTADGIELNVDGAGGYRFRTRTLVNAAGPWAPAVASSFKGFPAKHLPRPYFAKGHYYSYSGKPPFQHLVYPLPGNGGLGVHATIDLAGQVRFGPDVEWTEDVDYRFDDGRRERFSAAIRSYFPGLDSERLLPGYTGVRPKLAGAGEPAADFHIQGPAAHGIPGLVNLFGIESPGLTASLALAAEVLRRAAGAG